MSLGLVILISVKSFAAEPSFNCEPESWVEAPGIVNGMFNGTLAGKCTVSGAKPQGLVSGDEYFLGKTSKSSSINSGPTPETYENLPSVLYNVTDVSDQVTIKSDEHIATDRKTKLIYAAFSTDVEGSGLSGFLKKLDVIVEITPTSDPSEYHLKLITTIGVSKPAFIPNGSFEGRAEQSAKEQFEKKRDLLLPEIADHL